MSERELEGRVAIVTGAGAAASGIGNGRAAAAMLARAGARVGLLDVVAESMDETRELIGTAGGECVAVPCDVADPAACRDAVAAVLDAYGRLDVLVNNVGIVGPPGTVETVDLDAWEHCLRVNLTSVVLMSRFALPAIRAAGGGAIVNMSSVAGLAGGVPLVAYSASKGAINTLTKTMATQHGPEGVRVNAVAPGFVHTPLITTHGLSEADRERRRLAAPLRTEGTGWDVGEAVLFLASPRSQWITGVVLPVDAGLTATGFSLDSSQSVHDALAADTRG